MSPRSGVLVPIKSFAEAKGRLAGALNGADRSALARDLAHRVVTAAAPLPVAVVCNDPEVADWARSVGAQVFWCPTPGLNAAVTAGLEQFRQAGFGRVVIAHGDLPLAETLAWVADFDGVTVVPDRHDDGTNVLCVPTGEGFTFAYGVGSFRRHVAEANRLGLALRIVRDERLGWDVDVPADLNFPVEPIG